MKRKKTMEPEEIQTAAPAEKENEFWRDHALTVIATAHSRVQHILARELGSPSTETERLVITALSMIRTDLWDALKRLGGDDPRYIQIGRAGT